MVLIKIFCNLLLLVLDLSFDSLGVGHVFYLFLIDFYNFPAHLVYGVSLLEGLFLVGKGFLVGNRSEMLVT